MYEQQGIYIVKSDLINLLEDSEGTYGSYSCDLNIISPLKINCY